jgi:hypothetical protein
MYPSLDFLMSSAIVFHQENISTTNCALGHAMLLQCGLGWSYIHIEAEVAGSV